MEAAPQTPDHSTKALRMPVAVFPEAGGVPSSCWHQEGPWDLFPQTEPRSPQLLGVGHATSRVGACRCSYTSVGGFALVCCLGSQFCLCPGSLATP